MSLASPLPTTLHFNRNAAAGWHEAKTHLRGWWRFQKRDASPQLWRRVRVIAADDLRIDRAPRTFMASLGVASGRNILSLKTLSSGTMCSKISSNWVVTSARASLREAAVEPWTLYLISSALALEKTGRRTGSETSVWLRRRRQGGRASSNPSQLRRALPGSRAVSMQATTARETKENICARGRCEHVTERTGWDALDVADLLAERVLHQDDQLHDARLDHLLSQTRELLAKEAPEEERRIICGGEYQSGFWNSVKRIPGCRNPSRRLPCTRWETGVRLLQHGGMGTMVATRGTLSRCAPRAERAAARGHLHPVRGPW